MFRIRQITGWIYGWYGWILFAFVILIFGGLAALLRKPLLGRRIVHFGAKLLFRLAGMPLSAKGLDRLPAQPHVLLVNHGSFLDGIVLTALLPPRPGYGFIVRQEFKRQRVLCPLLRGLGAVALPPVASSKPGKSNIDILGLLMRRRKNLVIFPEGGFRPEPGLRRFHSGVFIAAASANVPLVIAGMRGARAALRPRTWLPRRIGITLEIGPTLTPAGTDRAAIAQLSDEARKAMLQLTGEGEAST
ncbi:MAG TPA: lysophospholipid acyltransferase family protein [Burkholderiaceae bacterium]|jgi:1-acyl-sn-glycerol-3-phosphate acyltransferase|nr:lysophospholipid acyltransferase family protein [Burkholderiaceae bacterium]